MCADGDLPWLPYSGSSLNSSVSLALGLVATVSTLGNVLATVAKMNETEIDNRRRAIRDVRNSHFTFRGLMDRISEFMHRPLSSELECSETVEPDPPKSLRPIMESSESALFDLSFVHREMKIDDLVLTFTCPPDDGFKQRAAALLDANAPLARALCAQSTVAIKADEFLSKDDLHSKPKLRTDESCALAFLGDVVSRECAKTPVVDSDNCMTVAECGQLFRAEANALIDPSIDKLDDSTTQQRIHGDDHARNVKVKEKVKSDGGLEHTKEPGNCVPRQDLVRHGWSAFVDSPTDASYGSNSLTGSGGESFLHGATNYSTLRHRCRIVQFFTSGLCEQWKNFLVSARETGVEELLIVFALDYESVECVRHEQRLRTAEDVGGVGGFGSDWPDNADRMVPALDLSLLRGDLQDWSPFGTDGFRRITELKFRAISLVLQLGLLVLYLDTDVILFVDPFSDLIDGDEDAAARASFLPRDLLVRCLAIYLFLVKDVIGSILMSWYSLFRCKATGQTSRQVYMLTKTMNLRARSFSSQTMRRSCVGILQGTVFVPESCYGRRPVRRLKLLPSYRMQKLQAI